MPYLNWKAALLKPVRTELPDSRVRLELALPKANAEELLADLKAALAPGGAELKVDLPESWTVYFKAREGLSRLQLAHPQTGEWVATVHLSEAHGQRLLQGLERAGDGRAHPRLVVSELGALGSINNFDLVLWHSD